MPNTKKLFAISLFAFALPFSFRVPISAPTAVNSSFGTNTSLNWSGYVASQGQFTSVDGTWTVPAVTSVTSTMADATWVGIGGVSSRDLIQAGTQALTDPSGSISYQAWYELLPSDMVTIPLTVNAGDSMIVSLAQTSSNVWQISFTNHTTGATYTTSVNYASSVSSAEWIEEMPTANIGFVPLDNFGTVSFTGGSAVENGTTLTIAQAGAQPITMVTQGNLALASPSTLGSDGASFTVTRTSVISAAPGGRTRYSVHGPGWRVGVGVSRYSRSGTVPSTTPARSITMPLFPWFHARFGRFAIFRF